jgi:hypothetical protein
VIVQDVAHIMAFAVVFLVFPLAGRVASEHTISPINQVSQINNAGQGVARANKQ